MDMAHTYINVLNDTLRKKKEVLGQIKEATQRQKKLLQADSFDEDRFQDEIAIKDSLLAELENLDNGFEQIYEKAALALKHNKDMYKEEILTAQQLIQEVMDLSVSIRAMEEQNKERFPACLQRKRSKIKTFKNSSFAVNNYYKNMPNAHQDGQSYFLDKKK